MFMGYSCRGVELHYKDDLAGQLLEFECLFSCAAVALGQGFFQTLGSSLWIRRDRKMIIEHWG